MKDTIRQDLLDDVATIDALNNRLHDMIYSISNVIDKMLDEATIEDLETLVESGEHSIAGFCGLFKEQGTAYMALLYDAAAIRLDIRLRTTALRERLLALDPSRPLAYK